MEAEFEERFQEAFSSSQPIEASLLVVVEVARSKHEAKYPWLRAKYSRLLSFIGDDRKALLQHQLDLLEEDDPGLREILLESIPSSVSDQDNAVLDRVCTRLTRLADATPHCTMSIFQSLSKIPGARRYCIDWATDCALHRINAYDLVVVLPDLLMHLVQKTEEASVLLPVIRSRVKKTTDFTKQLHLIATITQAFLQDPHDDLLFDAYQKHLIQHDSEALILLDAAIVLACSHGADLRQWLPHIPLQLIEKAMDLDQTQENQVWIIDAYISSENLVNEVAVRMYLRLPPTKKRELLSLILNKRNQMLPIMEKLIDASAIEDLQPLRGSLVRCLRKESTQERVEILCRIVTKVYSKSSNLPMLLKRFLCSLRRDERLKGLYMAREAIRTEAVNVMVHGWISRILFPAWRSPIDPTVGVLSMDCLEFCKPLDFAKMQVLLANTGLVQELSSYRRRNGCLLAFESSSHETEKHQVVFCLNFFLDRVDMRHSSSWADCVSWVFRLVDTYLLAGSKGSGKVWRANSWLSAVLELPSLTLPPRLELSAIEEHLNDFDSPIETLMMQGYHGCTCMLGGTKDDEACKIFEAVSSFAMGICACGGMLSAVLKNSCKGATTMSDNHREVLGRIFVLMAKAQTCFVVLDHVSISQKRGKTNQLKRPREVFNHLTSRVAQQRGDVTFAKPSAETSARRREMAFWTPSFLSLDIIWLSLDTNILLATIQSASNCSQKTTERSLSLYALVCCHLNAGFEKGSFFSMCDLGAQRTSKCFSLYRDLFQIIEELPMMLERQQSNFKVCRLTEEAVAALIRLLGILAERVIPKTWEDEESSPKLSYLRHLRKNENTRHFGTPAGAIFTYLMDRIKVVGSRDVCESSMDLLVRLGILIGIEETQKALEISWCSLQNSLTHDDVQAEVPDTADSDCSLRFLGCPALPEALQQMIRLLCKDLEDPYLLNDSNKRPSACESLLRHFSRLCMILPHHVTAWKNGLDIEFLYDHARNNLTRDNQEGSTSQGAALLFDNLLLACALLFCQSCKAPLNALYQSRELLETLLSLYGNLGRLYANSKGIFAAQTETIMLSASDAILCGLVSMVETSSRTNASTLFDHATKTILGVLSLLVEQCKSEQPSRHQTSQLKRMEEARGQALAQLSDCADRNNFRKPEENTSSEDNLNETYIEAEGPLGTNPDSMSTDTSFNANWGEEEGSSAHSLELETPTVVFQTM